MSAFGCSVLGAALFFGAGASHPAQASAGSAANESAAHVPGVALGPGADRPSRRASASRYGSLVSIGTDDGVAMLLRQCARGILDRARLPMRRGAAYLRSGFRKRLALS